MRCVRVIWFFTVDDIYRIHRGKVYDSTLKIVPNDRETIDLLLNEHIPNPKARQIYHFIRKGKTVSKQELQDESKLTGSTMTRVIDELIQAKLIVEVGFGESTGGRRPILYEVNATYGWVFGLDISRAYSRLVLCDMHLNVMKSVYWNMTRARTPEVFIEEVAQTMTDMLRRAKVDPDKLIGMGIGAVGPLDRQSGRILQPKLFLSPGWEHIDICTPFSDRFDIPVMLDNGVNNALLGEYWHDAADRVEHLLYVHVGVGLRSSMMINGQMVYGAVDMEGAVGQMIIDYDGVAHREADGNYGALESYATLYALEHFTRAKIKLGRSSILNEWVERAEDINYFDIVKALQHGDPLVREIISQAATQFGVGLANLLNVLHPEMVILGGPLIASNSLYYETATESALKKTYYYPDYQVSFSKGKLGEEALAIGSAALVIDELTKGRG